MIKKLKHKWLRFYDVFGIDIHLKASGEMLFTGVHIKNKKGAIDRVAVFEEIRDIQTLKKQIPPNIPVCISFNGNGILVRQKETSEIQHPVTTFFPAANPNEFYFASHENLEGITTVYIARKELIEEKVSKLAENGLPVAEIYIGATPIDNVLPFLSSGPVDIQVPPYKFSIQDNQIKRVEVIPDDGQAVINDLAVGNFHYKPSTLLALGNGFGLIGNGIENTTGISDLPVTIKSRKEYNNYLLFKYAGWACLSVTFALLLFNYLIFNNYYTKNQKLQFDKTALLEKNALADRTRKNIDSNYNYLIASGWNRASRNSYFSSHIGALVPETITLTALKTFPLDEDTEIHDYIFDTKTILIKGESYDPGDLDIFVSSIKNITGVKLVSLRDYLYRREIKGAVFTIKVTL